MIIKWYGQTSFLFQDSTGRRILINPFDIDNYDKLLSLNPSIIALTRTTTNINKNMYSTDSCKLIQDIEELNFDFVKICGYKSFHDNCNGLKRGENIIFTFLLDNIRLCHLGHLGHLLSDNFVSNLGDIDILLIPVGGHFALDGLLASTLCKKINPSFIIPMYYKTDTSLKFLDDCADFIISMKSGDKVSAPFINTSDLISANNPTVLLIKENNPI